MEKQQLERKPGKKARRWVVERVLDVVENRDKKAILKKGIEGGRFVFLRCLC
jgi:hypothetical protein